MTDDERSRVDRNEIDFFDTFYGEQTYSPAGHRLRYARELRSILRSRPGPRLGRVLSIGCGEGTFERMLAPHAEHVTALDISPRAIERARHLAQAQDLHNAEFHRLSVFDLEWRERFDTIVCLAFLHHVPEPELPGLLERLHAHLRPGGLLYSQDPNRGGLLRRVGRVVLGDRYDRYHSADERELDPGELRDALRGAGFARVDIVPIDLTLIPATYLLPQRGSWIFRACTWVDRAFCASPLGRWASGFAALSWRAPADPPATA